jgi:endonuclease I
MQRFKGILFLLLAVYHVCKGQAPELSVNSGNLPAGYYNSAEGFSCSTLKTKLSTIISNASNTFLYADVIAAHERTDKKRNDNNTVDVVWDVYSDNPTGADPYTFIFSAGNRCGQYTKEGDCYNREHIFPQAWFNSELPMMSDLHHLYPTDGFVNGLRSNFPFGEVTTASKTSLNGSKLGTGLNNFGYTSTVFEPINEYKGDIARAVLYMIVRYESQLPQWRSNSNANDILDGTIYPGLDPWHLKLLYKWHVQDPVSDKERKRNDSIYVILGNRNPFIDRPEWVFQIWSCTGMIVNTAVSETSFGQNNTVSIFPNPIIGNNLHLSFKEPLTGSTNIEIMDLQGKIIKKVILPGNYKDFQINTSQLNNGNYFIKIINNNKCMISKILK